jgi:hypothetical protein
MIITNVNVVGNEITYWYLNKPTARLLTMKNRYFSDSWLPDLYYNVVSVQQLAESYRTDFTHSEFILELLMLIIEYQRQIEQGHMSKRVFMMKMDNLNYHFQKNQINIVLDL